MLSNLSKILNEVNTFVVPQTCFGCNAALYRGEPILCAFCRNELPLTDYNYLQENAADRLFYGRCRVEKAASLLFYAEKGLSQRLIHQLKYRGAEQIGTFFGRWYGAMAAGENRLRSVDYVMPVPLHPARMRQRGYNQCSRFGREIARQLGAAYSESLLLRQQPSPTQTRKDRWQRWKSTHGSFRLPKPERIRDKKVLLVDDVITTGATLEACCKALEASNPAAIFIGTMAIVP